MTAEVLLATVGALSSAIAFLYRQQLLTLRRIESKLDECERDRRKLWEKVFALESAR